MTNTSARDGDEVVQVYLRFPRLPGAPRHALRGFARVHVRARETPLVRFTLEARDLGHVDAAGSRLVGAGKCGLSMGGGRPGTSAVVSAAGFEIRGDKRLPR